MFWPAAADQLPLGGSMCGAWMLCARDHFALCGLAVLPARRARRPFLHGDTLHIPGMFSMIPAALFAGRHGFSVFIVPV